MALGLLFVLACVVHISKAQEVTTSKGIVKGRYDGNGTALYLGIPFAKAPVGPLRWELPQPPDPWSTPFNATDYGHACVAVKSNSSFIKPFNENEDCLSVNVWVPRSVYENKVKVPVMVFIHGGAFILGSSSHHLTSPDPEQFARENSVVYVSFNYRLGPLGFFSHPKLKFLNFGLYDQIAALKWVKENIGQFYGDSSQITLSGSSAGAISICFLLCSPLTDGLFHRVVFQSTMCDFAYDTREEALHRTTELTQAVGCEIDDLECLRALPADSVQSTLPPARGILWTKGARWFPIVEGTPDSIAPANPVHTMAKENSVNKDIDIIIGYVKDEGSMFVFLGFPVVLPSEYLNDMLQNSFQDKWKKILDMYELDEDNDSLPDNLGLVRGFGSTASRFLSDIWECSCHRLASLLADHGNRVHVYKFLHPASYLSWPISAYLGVAHGSELNYIYSVPKVFVTEEDRQFAVRLSELWGWFTKHEEPYIHKEDWPAYTTEKPFTLHLLPGHKEEIFPQKPATCSLLDNCRAPDGLLIMLKAGEEPFYSWLFNVWAIQNRRGVAYGIAITVVSFFASLYYYFFGRKGKGVTSKQVPVKKAKKE